VFVSVGEINILEEYWEILDGLTPAGLCVHLKAESVAEGRAVMAAIRRLS
jgi:hypothetical protein